MSARPIPRWAGVALLIGIATLFASNHLAARIAFDHGTGVVTAVAVRSASTALAVAVLLGATGTAWRLRGATLGRATALGVVLAAQSVCLYAAVARIPVALALLVFNVFPILLALLSWASGGELAAGPFCAAITPTRPLRRAKPSAIAMPAFSVR